MITLSGENCTGCGTCADVCPHGVLRLENKKARIDHEDGCIECGACQLNCHDNAIRVTKGTGCLFIIVKEDILKLKKMETTIAGCC